MAVKDNNPLLRDELNRFRELWGSRGDSPIPHSAELWDKRAVDWIRDLGDDGYGDKAETHRVMATADYLRSRGLLSGDVADVGCGPGLFVTEFAKTANRAVGIDFSSRFVEFGRGIAEVRGLKNASFMQMDFLAGNIADSGLERAFDLAFSAISPAVSGKGGLEKFMRISRAWCCNISVVRATDSLAERVARDLYGSEARLRYDGVGFFALFNLLLLSGYSPETYYFTEKETETVQPVLRAAKRIAQTLGRSEADAEKILRYLEGTDDLSCESVFVYGSVLWNVNEVGK